MKIKGAKITGARKFKGMRYLFRADAPIMAHVWEWVAIEDVERLGYQFLFICFIANKSARIILKRATQGVVLL